MLLSAENCGLFAFIVSCSVFIGVKSGVRPVSWKICSANWYHEQ